MVSTIDELVGQIKSLQSELEAALAILCPARHY